MYIRRILVAVALLGLIGMGIFSYYVYNMLLAPNTDFDDSHVNVHIKTNATYDDVHEELKPYLKNMDNFDLVAQRRDYIQNIKAGRFKLRKDMSNNDIIRTLRSKNLPFPIFFNNQDRLETLAGRISNQIEADSTALLKAMTDSTFLAENNFDRQNALNMYIPNKYQFYWNTSAKEFRERMRKEYKAFWNDERVKKADSIGLDPGEVQTLASVVQKETSKPEERPRIAGVYMNRYKKGMKLDADPTVIYAIKKKQQDFDTIIRRVYYKNLEVDSPYNTYLHNGIPPGPIAMPDISSIEAVLNYENHDYFYFVADPERPGYHKFSKTQAQHIRQKKAYTNWLDTQI